MAAKTRSSAAVLLTRQTIFFRSLTLNTTRSPFSGSFPGGWRVKTIMGNPTIVAPVDKTSQMQRLHDDYDVAFRNWSAQVRVLQSVGSSETPDPDAIAQARRWVEEAAAIYREKRNLLLNQVIASRSRAARQRTAGAQDQPRSAAEARPDGPAPAQDPGPVQKLARQIWEEAGRPDGTAEADWLRAEEILHTRR